jgi:dipeptidyl aminopeptidase/acylaminoacyl peptidase
VLLIDGASGVGKSSFVRAGVTATLRRRPGWIVTEPVRPGVEGIGHLAKALAAALQLPPPPDSVVAGEPVVLRGHESSVWSAAFSPDGTRVVTASYDHTARVWRADGTGKPVVLRGHEGGVKSAAFSPDGTRVVTASSDHTARVWRADWATLIDLLRESTSACLTPADRRRYLGESEDEARAAWEVCERRHGRTPERHES